MHNDIFLDHNLKLHKMIDMHSKYDNMHTNEIFNALNYNNNHVISYKKLHIINDTIIIVRVLPPPTPM